MSKNVVFDIEEAIQREGIIPDKTIARRGRRQLAMMKAALSGGWKWWTPLHYPSVEEPTPVSTRAERRRAELGRV